MMHKSIEDVYEYIPKEILPKEYGGQEKTVAEMQGNFKTVYFINVLKYFYFHF